MPTLPVPGGQSMHDTAFTVVPYLPGSQLTQDRRSVVYFPGAHCSQTAPCAPFHPSLHWHAVSSVLMAREFEFAGHGRHCSDPNVLLYVAASHGTHCPVADHVQPGMHTQPLLPGADPVLAGHGAHA